MKEEIIAHHGVQGQRWGVRRQRDNHGNLTRYGAKKLSRKLNKLNTNKNRLYIPISYRDGLGKAHTVYQLNKKELSDYKNKIERGSRFGGILGATLSSKKYQIEKGREVTNRFLYGDVDYTTIIKDARK